jgi:hypothetical protein
MAVTLVFPLLTIAASDTYVFFDYKHCESHVVGNEPLTGNNNYEQWVKKAETFKILSDDTTWTEWNVFYIGDAERIGICRKTISTKRGITELYCHDQSYNTFPLAGATYKVVHNKKGELLWFRCVKRCNAGVPKLVYDEGYEAEESDPHAVALQQAYRQLEKKCARAARPPPTRGGSTATP